MDDIFAQSGEVLCNRCGHIVISNSGKIMLNNDMMRLHCWACDKMFDFKYCYYIRKEGQSVRIPRQPCMMISCRYNDCGATDPGGDDPPECICPEEQYDACIEDDYSGLQEYDHPEGT